MAGFNLQHVCCAVFTFLERLHGLGRAYLCLGTLKQSDSAMLIALSSAELGDTLLEILESAPLSAQTNNRFPSAAPIGCEING